MRSSAEYAANPSFAHQYYATGRLYHSQWLFIQNITDCQHKESENL